VGLAIDPVTVMQVLTAMLGAPPVEPLEFRPSMRLDSGYGRSLAAHVCAGLEDFERAGSLLHHPLAQQV